MALRFRAAWMGLAILLGAVLLWNAAPNAVSAQGDESGGGEFELPPGVTWDAINAIAHQIYYGMGGDVPLDECETVACRQWRQEIARLLSEGRTEDEIVDYFAERYGADVVSLPRNESSGGEFELPPGVTWDAINAVARQMYCDVCEGVPLDECESVTCRRWRQEIARLLSQGKSEDEIIDHFAERYGTDVASLPRDKKDRFLVYAIPGVMVLLLSIAWAVQVRNLRQRGHQPGQAAHRTGQGPKARPVPDEIDPVYLERLQRELERLES